MTELALKRAIADFKRVSNACDNHEHEYLQRVRLYSSEKSTDGNGSADDNVFKWIVTLQPPEKSVYAPETYELMLTLESQQYPFKEPSVQVITPIFNPLVSEETGELCENLVKSKWKPVNAIVDVLVFIAEALFVNYAKFDPLNVDAASLLSQNKLEEFAQKVKAVRNKENKSVKK